MATKQFSTPWSGIYVAQAGYYDAVKVGYSGNIHQRIAEIQPYLPDKFILRFVLHGASLEHEKYSHFLLRDARIHHEWFQWWDGVLIFYTLIGLRMHLKKTKNIETSLQLVELGRWQRVRLSSGLRTLERGFNGQDKIRSDMNQLDLFPQIVES